MATIKAYRVDIKQTRDGRASCTVYATFSEPESLAGQETAVFYGMNIDAEAILAQKNAQIQTALNLLDGWDHDGPDDEATKILIRRLRVALGVKTDG